VTTPLILVLVAVAFSVTGEIFLKEGMNRVGVLALGSLPSQIPLMLRTWPLYAGFGSIAVGAIFWLGAISRAELSWAYPLLATGYILMLVFSALVLGEHITPARWIGTALIVLGVILVCGSWRR